MMKVGKFINRSCKNILINKNNYLRVTYLEVIICIFALVEYDFNSVFNAIIL